MKISTQVSGNISVTLPDHLHRIMSEGCIYPSEHHPINDSPTPVR